MRQRPVQGAPRPAGSSWTRRDRLGHWRVRWGIRRRDFRVEPGLYALGSPGRDSLVFVSANYRLSFDHLRRALAGRDAWILVLDSAGVNVWCAAGKGTFGTDELAARIESTGLAARLAHRTLVVPQLGATGIAAAEVERRTGFAVRFGPVRAADLPAYLDAGLQATPTMRRATFTLRERLVLVPVELVQAVPWTTPLVLVLLALGGLTPQGWSLSAARTAAPSLLALGIGAAFAGAALTPLLLPWLPGRPFSAKGAVAGLAWALLLAWASPAGTPWEGAGRAAVASALAAFLAMQFTGSSVITSLSGVRKEMRTAVPLQIAATLLGLVLLGAGRVLGGAG